MENTVQLSHRSQFGNRSDSFAAPGAAARWRRMLSQIHCCRVIGSHVSHPDPKRRMWRLNLPQAETFKWLFMRPAIAANCLGENTAELCRPESFRVARPGTG